MAVPSVLAQAPRNSGLPPPVPVLLRGQRACAWTGFSAVLGWEVRPCSFPQKAPKAALQGRGPSSGGSPAPWAQVPLCHPEERPERLSLPVALLGGPRHTQGDRLHIQTNTKNFKLLSSALLTGNCSKMFSR